MTTKSSKTDMGFSGENGSKEQRTDSWREMVSRAGKQLRTARGLQGNMTASLARRLLSGEICAGETLDPELLAEEFGVSRTVVRESVRALSAKGMLDARPNRGTFVRPRLSWNLLDPELLRWHAEAAPPIELFRQLAEVRVIVEPDAARLAAKNRSDAQLSAIADALSAMQVIDAARKPEEATRADLAFHAAVLQATGNELLQQIEAVVEVTLSLRDRFVHSRPGWRDPVPVHREVYEAIAAGDQEAAATAAMKLLEQSFADLETVASQSRRSTRARASARPKTDEAGGHGGERSSKNRSRKART
jgi:DNA-binding FadR family transcriptional regulator